MDACLYIRCVQLLKGQDTKHAVDSLKGSFTQKLYFCHYLLTHMLSQTFINFFLVLNTKEDILKNLGNQTVAGPH